MKKRDMTKWTIFGPQCSFKYCQRRTLSATSAAFCGDFCAVYKCLDLLTYLLTYLVSGCEVNR